MALSGLCREFGVMTVTTIIQSGLQKFQAVKVFIFVGHVAQSAMVAFNLRLVSRASIAAGDMC